MQLFNENELFDKQHNDFLKKISFHQCKKTCKCDASVIISTDRDHIVIKISVLIISFPLVADICATQ